MKTTFFNRCRWVVVGLTLVLSAGAWADTVKLKDGTTAEGNIISEDDKQVVLELNAAGGSITSWRTIAQSEIAEVVRDTPAEKAQKAMELAYEFTKRYQLDPQHSLATERYDQVINGPLRKFLADYPDSPHTEEMNARIAEWTAERDRVVNGEVKVDGKWLSSAEAEGMQAEELVKQARQLIAMGRFAEAAQRLERHQDSYIAKEAKQQCYQAWLEYLRNQKKTVEANIANTKKNISRANSEANTATKFKSHDSEIGKSADGIRGGKGSYTAWTVAKNKVVGQEQLLTQYEAELAEIKRTLAVVEARGKVSGVQVASADGESPATTPAAAPAQPAPEADEEEAEILTSIASFAKKYWMWAAGFLVIAFWFVSRRMGQ